MQPHEVPPSLLHLVAHPRCRNSPSVADIPPLIRLPPTTFLRTSLSCPSRKESPSRQEYVPQGPEAASERARSAREVESRGAEGVRVLAPRRERPRRPFVDIYARADHDAEVREFPQRLEGGDERGLWRKAVWRDERI